MIAVMLMSVALIAGLYVLAYTLAVYALPVSPDDRDERDTFDRPRHAGQHHGRKLVSEQPRGKAKRAAPLLGTFDVRHGDLPDDK